MIRRLLATVVLAAVAGTTLAGCVMPGKDPASSASVEPAVDSSAAALEWTEIGRGPDRATRIHKACDGTTLLYATQPSSTVRSTAITAVPNAPECQP